jgi:UDP-MurNAc hydroxylase
MKFEFIGNACGIFHGSKGTKLLCDPWIVDGVFEGSWFHYPPLKTTYSDLQDVDAIYLSHLHPDHYDERHFNFRKNVAIFILDEKYKFLERKLRAKGYQNLAVIADGATHSFNEFEVTLFAPFTKHPFFECEIGNVIDSAMVIKDVDGTAAFNANDNTPSVQACKMLRQRFGTLDLAMLNYNAAGPYPACFKMRRSEKFKEHQRILERNFDYMVELLDALKPKHILPFAGAYVLGGKLAKKNKFLGTTTWDHCISSILYRLPKKTHALALRELGIFDLATGIAVQDYVAIDEAEMEAYTEQISHFKYPYELDPKPNGGVLLHDIIKAAWNMRSKMAQWKLKSETTVDILFGQRIVRVLGNGGTPMLQCKVPSRLLRRILDGKAHWNNAEIGCHIEFDRLGPYEPDLHTALEFLHL